MHTKAQVNAHQMARQSHSSTGVGGLGVVPHSDAPIAPALSNELTRAHTDFISFHEGYVRHYVSLADTKATTVLGVVAGLLAYLFSQPKFNDLIFNPAWTAAYIQMAVTTLFLALAAGCAALVIVPRLGHSGEGVVFYGAVANHASSDAYLQQIAQRNEPELTAARIRHSYDVSKACVRKYDMLRKAVWFGFIGIASSLQILGSLKA
jgi:Family of unknown function (DUF5706)